MTALTRFRFNRQSVVVTWLLSYLSVLLVPVMVSGVLYAATWHVVESEVNRANESMLRQLEQAIDNNLNGIERLSVEMALSRRLAAFMNAEQPLTDDDHYQLMQIAADLRSYKVANDFIDEVYVYYKNSDTVLASNRRLDGRGLFGLLHGKDTASYEQWKALLDRRYVQEYIPVTMQEGDQTAQAVVYAKSLVLDNPEQPGAVLLFVVKEAKLLANIAPADKTTVAVLDRKNRWMASAGSGKRLEALTYEDLPGRSGVFYSGDSGEEAAVSYTTSEGSGWKYISTVPAEVFDEKMKFVTSLIWISLVLSLLIGGVVTAVFIRKNYSPIGLLIERWSTRSGVSFSGESSEFGYLEQALEDTFAEKEKIGRRLSQHRDAIRAHFLQGLLTGRLESHVPLHESLAAHDLRLISPEFGVITFQVEGSGKFDVRDYSDIQKEKLVNFLILNVAQELGTEGDRLITTELDGMPVCIVNLGPGSVEDALVRIAQGVKAFMEEHFHVGLTAAVSGTQQEWRGISLAYQQTLEALEYRLVMGSGGVIPYDELARAAASRTPGHSYYYPLHVEQQLINFVKTGDDEQADRLIGETIARNEAQALLSVPLAKCLMFDLMATLLKTLEDIGPIDQHMGGGAGHPIDRLTVCGTIGEMRGELREVLDQICRTVRENRSREPHQLSRQVMQYIAEHYSSEHLNITSIGEAFGLTPSYVSKQFKSQTGEALLDVINRTRLEEAKKLLAQQSFSVAEVARRVGYSDLNTFGRIFKKFEGVTPGKYKDIT
ncbi:MULTISPECIES: helix-turn-helix domain-containing protein [Paenibacillus]|uniref:helix-turn-helix domain-containing protein n=1 Tax=Paenibacillus TaxID=44249 RepID=UPI0022B8EED9|nr:helix-turn-helix domain-containing protein [Paenibacillus caseinilyticus]MCZ8520355.1 helix-turn-helix domain-containing protein [Paenibacillus caseinilyticus]